MDARMRANVSVLHPAVTVPAACLPFDVIPASWRAWYQAVLEDGKRMPPPEALQATISRVSLQVQQHTGSQHFEITELYEFDSDVLYHAFNLTRTKRSVYAASQRVAVLPSTDAKITTTPRQRHLIAVWLESKQLRVRNLSTGTDVHAEVRGEKLITSGERIYLKAGASLLELTFVEVSNQLFLAAKPVGNVLPNATQLYEGVALQNLLGAYYASFVPASGVCYPVRLSELDGYQIIEAKAERNVLLVLAAKNGAFDKFIFRLTPEFDAYDVRICSDVTLTDLNFTVLDTGVCLHLNDRDELEVFASGKGATGLKVIRDAALSSDDKLWHEGGQALLARRNKLYRITMR
jgi:hypothetical protein